VPDRPAKPPVAVPAAQAKKASDTICLSDTETVMTIDAKAAALKFAYLIAARGSPYTE
jgi:hypothetical protein